MKSLARLFSEKNRYITSLIMIAIVLPTAAITSYAGTGGRYFGMVVIMAIAAIGLYEFYRIMNVPKIISMLMPLVVVPFFVLGFEDLKDLATDTSVSQHQRQIWALQEWKNYLIILVISLLPVISVKYRQETKQIAVSQVIIFVVTVIALAFAKSLWAMLGKDFLAFIYLVGIAALSDTGGYLGGKLWGEKWFKGAKMAPRISPKKTWAGFLVGTVCAVIFAVIFGYFTHIFGEKSTANEFLAVFLGGIVVSLIAPVGGLFFSSIKRYQGVKDFSKLLPGHGGIFDRIDALMFVTILTSIIFLI